MPLAFHVMLLATEFKLHFQRQVLCPDLNLLYNSIVNCGLQQHDVLQTVHVKSCWNYRGDRKSTMWKHRGSSWFSSQYTMCWLLQSFHAAFANVIQALLMWIRGIGLRHAPSKLSRALNLGGLWGQHICSMWTHVKNHLTWESKSLSHIEDVVQRAAVLNGKYIFCVILGLMEPQLAASRAQDTAPPSGYSTHWFGGSVRNWKIGRKTRTEPWHCVLTVWRWIQ